MRIEEIIVEAATKAAAPYKGFEVTPETHAALKRL
jgi:hypothetical protein